MIEDRFDARTLANMNVALERVCQRRPDGENHKVRRRVAQRIIQCAIHYSGPRAFSAPYLFYSAAP
jgi:ribosomal protein L32E